MTMSSARALQFAVIAVALTGMAVPAAAAPAASNAAAATAAATSAAASGQRSGGKADGAKKYCLEEAITGSRMAKKVCKTAQDWLRSGVDVNAQ